MSVITTPRRRGSRPPERKPSPKRPSLSTRWGMWVARRRWWVLGAWGALVVAAAVSYPHLMSSLVASDYSVGGSDSKKVAELIQSDFSAAGAEQDVIVFNSATLKITDPEYQQVVDRVLGSVRGKPGVVSVLGPTDPGAQQAQISKDGHASLASMGLNGNDRQRGDRAKSLQHDVQSTAGKGAVQAYLTGYSPSANDLTDVENADVERAESIGIPVAFAVLLLALGALVAACVPLLVALASLIATFGILSALALVTTFDAFLLSIVTMIGVGVSIDYSLFVISRFREELARAHVEGRRDAVASAVGVAMTTSGRTIAFSGTIVMISLFSLFVVNSPLFHGIAEGAVLVVAVTLVTAWTMLPALLAVLGPRVNRLALPRRFQPADTQGSSERTNGWARWARTVLTHPWLAAPAAALLILFAVPLFGVKLGINLGLASVANTPSGKGEVILSQSFTPGLLSPVQVLASHRGSGGLSSEDLSTIEQFTTSVAKDKRVAGAYSISTLLRQTQGQVSAAALARAEKDPAMKAQLAQVVNTADGSNRSIITVVTKAPIDSTQATDLVHDLRNHTIPSYTGASGPQMLVGGSTAQFVDLSAETLAKLPLVMALVLSLSFVYLLVIFRALLIPLKAVLMNLLATAASLGLVIWVFQGGHLQGVFGFTSVGYIQTYLPIMVFAVLFGLSMDYEVFLIRRMQEQWLKTHDNDEAVVSGIAHTARPIIAAAAIMAAVFGCFLVADVLELKQFGFALAAAVILDATVIRLLLVPAVMKLAGRANWWLPSFLERVLPRVRID